MQAILSRKHDDGARDALGRTALHYAAAAGSLDLTKLLLGLKLPGLGVADTDKGRNNALHIAGTLVYISG